VIDVTNVKHMLGYMHNRLLNAVFPFVIQFGAYSYCSQLKGGSAVAR